MMLFLSFTAMAHQYLLERSILDDDLDRSLFYFGCDRSHVMNPLPKGVDFTKITQFGDEVPCQEAIVYANRRGLNPVAEATHIKMVLEKAESAGRCEWWRINGRESEFGRFQLLIELLFRNGMIPMLPDGNNPIEEWTRSFKEECRSYSYPGTADFLTKRSVPLEVIY